MPSKSILEQKQESVRELSEKIKTSKAMVLVDYRGLTVEQDTDLRNALRKAGIEYRVVKNSIVRFAVKENGLEELDGHLKGPTALALSDTDPVGPAKVMSEYSKKYDKLELKAGVVEGRVIDLTEVKALAQLPSKEVLVARALGGFNAPLSGLVNVLNGNIRGLVVALNAIAEKQGA